MPTMKEYSDFTDKTKVMKSLKTDYFVLGLCGEAGEVADKVKKLYRDHDNKLSESYRLSILKELGDVLWYLTNLCKEFDSSLDEVAEMNMKKLMDRQKRNKLTGEGDER